MTDTTPEGQEPQTEAYAPGTYQNKDGATRVARTAAAAVQARFDGYTLAEDAAESKDEASESPEPELDPKTTVQADNATPTENPQAGSAPARQNRPAPPAPRVVRDAPQA